MLDAHTVALFAVSYALAAALPGAAQGVMVARVAALGASQSAPFVAGMIAGNALWLAAAALGLAALATKLSAAFLVVKWAGVAYLAWLAFKLWTAHPEASSTASPARLSAARGVASGAALTLGNPKAVVCYSAVLPHVFDMRSLDGTDLGLIFVLGALVDGSVQVSYMLVVERARRLLKSSRAVRRVNRGAAVVIAGSATAIAVRS